jgi:hypothetical protein
MVKSSKPRYRDEGESKIPFVSSGEHFTETASCACYEMRGGIPPRPKKNPIPAPSEDLQQLRAALDAFRDSESLSATRPGGHRKTEAWALVAERETVVSKGQRRGLSLATVASIFGHATLLSVILLSATAQIPKSQLIAVAVEILPQRKSPHQLAPAVAEPESVASGESSHKNTERPQATSNTEVAQATSAPSLSEAMSANSVEGSAPEIPISRSPQSPGVSEVYLSNANETSADSGGGITDFVEQGTQQSPELTVTHKTDWQTNPVDDNTLTYSAPGGGMRLTVREASSGGFVSSGFATSFGATNEETTDNSGLATTAWDDTAKAQSEKVDWTLINQKNFGLTTFGYRNEVGYEFQSFGQNKKEFATPGTSTMEFGGEARLGAFALGLAHSDITKLDSLAPAFSSGGDNAVATLDEASLKVDLHRFLAAGDGLAAKLIPTVWISAGERQSADASQVGTNSTSFGGSWSWNHGYASLDYWNYSSNGDAIRGADWSGQGLAGSLGMKYAAFGVNAGVSYGRSAEASPMWQSAGELYNTTMTASYTPKKLPGIWASATAGNYNQDGLAYGSASSEIYGTSTKGEYWSMAAGLDVTNWFWSPELASEDASPSVKLLYRYTDALTVDSAASKTSDSGSLVAVMIQRHF